MKTSMVFRLAFCMVVTSSLSIAAEDPVEVPQQMRFYIGTYTNGKSEGIYVSTLNRDTGELAEPTLAGETDNPSFLAIHPSGNYLYAVGEISSFDGQRSGAVTAWKINQETGQLEFLGEDPSGGEGPCHLNVDNSGRTLLITNYGGGSVSSRELFHNGTLGNQVSFHQHVGSSINPRRQREPHAHSINLDPGNQYAFVADLGLDQILVYRFESIGGELKPNSGFPYAKVKPGSGPRHFSFHPNGKFAYVINELNSTITAFRYDSQRGRAGGVPDDLYSDVGL